MAAMFLGGLLLIGHLADQIHEGAGSAWSLVTGSACLVIGLILGLLFAILIRLHRVEQGNSGSDRLETDRNKDHVEAKDSASESAMRK